MLNNLIPDLQNDSLFIAGVEFKSRLFTGTGKYKSREELSEVLQSSESEMITVAFKRVEKEGRSDSILEAILPNKHRILPNTSGVRTAQEAIFVAEMAREALGTNWIKLEIHPDPKWLMPDPVETYLAAVELVKRGFVVLPYCHADPVLCKKLEDAGCAAVMPLGAPIGSNKGLISKDFLEIILAQANVPVIIDAGIGRPSEAALAMEMGAAAVLVNTALSSAQNSNLMAEAFKWSVRAGRQAFLAGLGQKSFYAQNSSPITNLVTSPLTAFLDESDS
jgi:thiazole synthase